MKTKTKPADPDTEHPVRLYLPASAHRALRILAAEQGIPMSKLVRAIILDALKSQR